MEYSPKVVRTFANSFHVPYRKPHTTAEDLEVAYVYQSSITTTPAPLTIASPFSTIDEM